LFNELGFKIGCEVGLFRGRNARAIFREMPGLKLYGVDPFNHDMYSSRPREEERYARNRENTYGRLKDYDAIIIEKFSEDAVKDIPYNSMDFVYIDGDHAYDYVMTDIILWSRRVRKDGIISGHDYVGPEDVNWKPDIKIKQAVDHYTAMHDINNWYITDKTVSKNRSDRTPSWFFTKTW
jgi:hypothetical protein